MSRKKKQSNPLKEQIRKEIDLSNGKEQFIRCRNWQTQQCSFLIGLLNIVGDLVIERPIKIKTKSLPFYRVQSITINGTVFDIKEMIAIFEDCTTKVFEGRFINWIEYKNDLKNDLTKYINKKTKTNPLVIPVIISTELPEKEEKNV